MDGLPLALQIILVVVGLAIVMAITYFIADSTYDSFSHRRDIKFRAQLAREALEREAKDAIHTMMCEVTRCQLERRR